MKGLDILRNTSRHNVGGGIRANRELGEGIDFLHSSFTTLTLSFTSRVAAEHAAKYMRSCGIFKLSHTHRHHESFTVKEEMRATVKLALS